MYPFALTNPNKIPQVLPSALLSALCAQLFSFQNDTKDPIILPPRASPAQILEQAINLFVSISQNPVFQNDPCAACQASLAGAKFVALAAPEEGPAFAIQFCEAFTTGIDCPGMFGVETMGPIFTQVVAAADIGGFDGRVSASSEFTYLPGLLAQLSWFHYG